MVMECMIARNQRMPIVQHNYEIAATDDDDLVWPTIPLNATIEESATRVKPPSLFVESKHFRWTRGLSSQLGIWGWHCIQ